jgi:hypothetical protein
MKSSRERESAIAAQHHLPDLAVTTLPPFSLATKLGQEDGSSNKATKPEMEALIEEARLEHLFVILHPWEHTRGAGEPPITAP